MGKSSDIFLILVVEMRSHGHKFNYLQLNVEHVVVYSCARGAMKDTLCLVVKINIVGDKHSVASTAKG